MPLSDITSVTISLSGPTPSVAGFGVPLLMAYHTGPNVLKSYASITEVVVDHAINTAAYDMALEAFAQSPAPPQVYIGKRTVGSTRTWVLTPTNLTVGYVYAFDLVDGATTTHVSYTVQNADTATTIVTGLKTSIGTPTGVTVGGTATLTLTAAAAGNYFYLKNLPSMSDLLFADNTADPGIVTDITAVAAIDATSWYGIALDSSSKAETEALAVWVEANEKLLVARNSDSACADMPTTSTTDVMAQTKTSAYMRTANILSANATGSYLDVAWMSQNFGKNPPGVVPWFYNTLAGPATDVLTSAQQHAVTGIPSQGTLGKNGSVYVVQNNLNITLGGRVASGEWIDVIILRDVLKARLGEAIFGALKAAADRGDKIPFTDSGIALVESAMRSVLGAQVKAGALASYTVTVPKAADVSASDKSNRLLSGIKFTAVIAGAVYATVLTGVLTK